MVRHTNTKMIVMKEEVYTHRSLESGGMSQHAMQGHTGKHRGQSRGRGNEGKTWTRAFIAVSAGGTDEVA